MLHFVPSFEPSILSLLSFLIKCLVLTFFVVIYTLPCLFATFFLSCIMTAKSNIGSDKCCRWIFMRAMDTTYISVLLYLCQCIHENRIYNPRWTGRWQMVVGEEKYFHLLWLYLVKLIFNVILDNLNSNSSFTRAGDLCWKPLWLLEQGNRQLLRFHLQRSCLSEFFCFW